MILPSTEMPFKQVPVLEVDGTSLTQSHSMARYLARTYKIAGQTDLEQAHADEYVDIVYDLITGKKLMNDSPFSVLPFCSNIQHVFFF